MPELRQTLMALLFVAQEPVPSERLAQLTGRPVDAVNQTLQELEKLLPDLGLDLSELDGTYRLVTSPDVSEVVRGFLREEAASELSRPALETLAIIAYRGPMTRSAVDAVRGVASETMIRNLLGRNLIASAGRSDEPGKPDLYTISHGFLQHFGLTSSDQLPLLPEEPNEN